MEKFKETQISSKKVFSGVLLHVYKDDVKLPSGNTSIREYIKHQGASVVIPILDNEILFVKQYRYPTQQVMLELPAGKIDPGEDELATVKRELGEETGYTSKNIFPLQPIHPSVGYSNEVIHLFIATNLQKSDLKPDDDEVLELVSLTLSDAMEKIYSGEISDSKTIIGIFWVDKLMNDKVLREKFGVELSIV